MYKQVFARLGAHLRYTNVFLMHALAVIPLTPLKFPLSSCTMCLSTWCYYALAESVMGSSACRPITQTCICGKEGWLNSDFLLRVLCCLVLSHIIYFLHKVSSAQLLLIPVVGFQRARSAPPICHLGEETETRERPCDRLLASLDRDYLGHWCPLCLI